MKKAVILARVSTTKQEKEGLSLKEIQIPALQDYAKRKGLLIEREFVFSETAGMGIRKKFDEMIEYVKSNPDIRAIIAYRVDRVTRNFRDAVMVEDLRLERGIEIHFVHDRLVIDGDPSGRDIQTWDLQVFLAKQYLNRLKEDANASASRMLESGLLPGKAPYGYKNIVDEKRKKGIILDPFKAKVVEKVYEWYSSGAYSMLEIKQKLNNDHNINMSKGSIDFILKNPFYYGMIHWGGKFYPHNYECIISKDLFLKVQDIKAGFSKKRFKYAGLPYVYRGLIHCADCGCMITPEMKKGKYVYYHCTGYNGKHDAAWLREEDLTNQFAEIFKSIQIPKNILRDITESLKESHKSKIYFYKATLEKLQNEFQKYESRIETMYEDKLDGSITETFYNRKREEYRLKQDEIGKKIERLSGADEQYYLTSEYLLKLANRAYELFMSSELNEKRQLIKLVLQNLKLSGKKIEFEFVRPFDQVFSCTSSQSWLPRLDSNQRPSG